MYPYPTFGRHTIAGESFELMDGIFGMAVERAQRQNRHLYFHALASESENAVPVVALQNRTAWATDENAFAESFIILGPRGSQSAASAIDTNGNLFFGLNNANALACWDTAKKPLTRNNVKTLVKDDERLQFAAGMKVIRNTDGEEELWLVTNRFQVISVTAVTRKVFSLCCALFVLKFHFLFQCCFGRKNFRSQAPRSGGKIPIKLSCSTPMSKDPLTITQKTFIFLLVFSFCIFTESHHGNFEQQRNKFSNLCPADFHPVGWYELLIAAFSAE